MSERFRMTLGQMNPTLGDLAANADIALDVWRQGISAGADFVGLPEMFLTGYQAQDLVSKPQFVADVAAQLTLLAERTADGPALGIGAPAFEGTTLHNAYFILKDGKVSARTLKHHLPNTNVFDEHRYFTSGPVSGPFSINGVRLGVPICEDAWHPDVAETMVESGAEILFVPNGSPYYRGKLAERMNNMVARVIENDVPLVYLNLVGGQDDQVFDGRSFALNRGGHLAMQLDLLEETVVHVDFERDADGWRALDGPKAGTRLGVEMDYHITVTALRDYMRKTGFAKVLLGLSGGIDSAIVATIAADALGPENVRCVMLPSEFTSDASLADARAVATALGCRLDTVPITQARAAVTDTLHPLFEGLEADVTEENIQSRLRGLLLMALSNKFGEMLLTTGNKSEVAVGYATIYGDMAGGYNPIKDLYKMQVFETCRWRNANHRSWMMGPEGEVISPNIIDKPPTAELRADQKDEDSLPPYVVLDGILEMLIEDDASVEDCVVAGLDRDTVRRVEHLIYISEYKRFQSAPGTRLSHKAFWLDRRYPIVNRWRDRS